MLVADLVAAGEVERLPEETADTGILGAAPYRCVRIEPFEAAAPIKLLLALAQGKRRAEDRCMRGTPEPPCAAGEHL